MKNDKNYVVYYYLFSDNKEAFIVDSGYNHSSELDILSYQHGSIIYTSATYLADVIIINNDRSNDND